MNIIPLKGEVIQMVQPQRDVILQILFKGLKIKVSVSTNPLKHVKEDMQHFSFNLI